MSAMKLINESINFFNVLLFTKSKTSLKSINKQTICFVCFTLYRPIFSDALLISNSLQSTPNFPGSGQPGF